MDSIKIKKLSIININTYLCQHIVIKQIQNDAYFTFKEMRALSMRAFVKLKIKIFALNFNKR